MVDIIMVDFSLQCIVNMNGIYIYFRYGVSVRNLVEELVRYSSKKGLVGKMGMSG